MKLSELGELVKLVKGMVKESKKDEESGILGLIFGAIVMSPMILAAWANQRSMEKDKKENK